MERIYRDLNFWIKHVMLANVLRLLVPSYFTTRSQDEGMPGQRYRIRPLDIVSESFVFKGDVLQVESSSSMFTFLKRTPWKGRYIGFPIHFLSWCFGAKTRWDMTCLKWWSIISVYDRVCLRKRTWSATPNFAPTLARDRRSNASSSIAHVWLSFIIHKVL